jgi:phosphoserine phosphatase
MPHLVLHKPSLSDSLLQNLQQLGAAHAHCHGAYFTLNCPQPVDPEALESLSEQYQVDINVFPESGASDGQTTDLKNMALLITDMDSTLINIECVDEIADFAGKKAEVSAITEAAMRGELDFNASLSRRVAVLKGLSVNVLDEVYRHRLKLNPGAEALLQGLQQQQIKTALVSGGFTYFTDKLRERLGFDFVLSNVLGLEDGELTGEVKGEIVNADRKAQFLQDICSEMNIDTRQAIAVGDGANDLKMMHLAGLSVAFRAKPTVRRQADIQLNYSGLDSILHILDFANNYTKKSA